MRPALLAIKSLHTLVFFGELLSIGWLVLSGLRGRRDRTVAAAAAMVAAEAAVFVANRGVCPLTPLAERHGAVNGSVSDIFLPDRVARTIPIWSSALIVVAVLLHARRIRSGPILAAVARSRAKPRSDAHAVGSTGAKGTTRPRELGLRALPAIRDPAWV
jgi:hypothetical protein